MNPKLSEIILVYEDYKENIKTDYVSKIAVVVGLIAVLCTLVSELLFRMWEPIIAFWTTLFAIVVFIINNYYRELRPSVRDHKRLRRIVNTLRYINVRGKLTKSQEEVLDKMWNEVYFMSKNYINLKPRDRDEYLNKIESWTSRMYKLRK